MNNWIETYSGERIFPFHPDPAAINLIDIAHSLSMQCRYTGHSRYFYSVAQHSVLLARHFFTTPNEKRAALLHDASEAYLSDIPAPLKVLPAFEFYREAEQSLQRVIYEKFGVEMTEILERDLHIYDREMLYHEVKVNRLLSGEGWAFPKPSLEGIRFSSWVPREACQEWLKEWNRTA